MRLIRTDAGLHALRPAWDALWSRIPGASPFQSPAWLLPWWQAFGTGQPLVVVLDGPDGTVHGLLPLYFLDERSERKLLPIGIGVTDNLDALALPDVPVGRLLAAALAAADTATVVALTDLAPGAALLDAPLPSGWQESRARTDPCPILGLPGVPPPGMARNLRQSRHRADRAGGWSVAVAADPLATWDTLVGLHRSRWTRLGHRDGVLGDPAVLAFHAASVPQLAAAGVLRFYVLHIGSQLAAVYYTLATKPGRLLFYLSAFNEAFARESPGTLLMGAVIEQATAEGIRELDFLRGAEPYKYAWSATDCWNTARTLTRDGRT